MYLEVPIPEIPQKMFLEAEYDCIGYSDKCIEKIDLGGDNAILT